MIWWIVTGVVYVIVFALVLFVSYSFNPRARFSSRLAIAAAWPLIALYLLIALICFRPIL